VINCWFWHGNVKLLLWALRIKGSYQKCDWEKDVKESGEGYKDNI
jgi:hypothetical protein